MIKIEDINESVVKRYKISSYLLFMKQIKYSLDEK